MSAEDNEIWQSYANDGAEALRDIEESLLVLEGDPKSSANVNRLYRGLHTLKGNSGFMRLVQIERLAHVSEDLIGLVRDRGVALDDEIIEMMLKVVDRLAEVVNAAGQDQRDASPERVADLVAAVSAVMATRDPKRDASKAHAAPQAPLAPPTPPPPSLAPVTYFSDRPRSEPVQLIDPAQDAGYVEVFLSMAKEALPDIGAGVLGTMQPDGVEVACASLCTRCDDLLLAADRMGYVHVVDVLARMKLLAQSGGRDLTGLGMLELDLYAALEGIEEIYRGLAEMPMEFGIANLYRRACANLAFGDIARLRTLLESPREMTDAELRALFQRLRAACEYYGFVGGARSCLDQEDQFGRAIEAGKLPDSELVARACEFVEQLGHTIHLVNEGADVSDVPVAEPADDPMKFARESASLPMSEALRHQLTRTALGALTQLMERAWGVYEIRAMLEQDITVAAAFSDWIATSGAVLVSSAVEDVTSGLTGSPYLFLIGAAATHADLTRALRAIDPSGKLVTARRLDGDAAPPPTVASVMPRAASMAPPPMFTPAFAPPAFVDAPAVAARPVDAAPEPAEAPEGRDGGEHRDTGGKAEFLRIDARKVSLIMDLAGEIGLACGAVTHHPDIEGLDLEDFNSASHKLEVLIRELQNEVSAMRLVPVAGVFQRMRRVVRDAARRTNKKVELVLVGEETEIDKVMVDCLADPLVHMLRNAVDHGIETPEERVAAGKSPTGRVVLEASHQGGEVSVMVIDDGRGLDRDKVLARARERGLITPDAKPTEDEITALVFLPGFSTKESIDELSGRGVGMDVIKTTIEGLRGRVHLKSTPGRGSRMQMTVPLTLAFVEAMVVRERDRLFALPIEKVFEVFKADTAQLSPNAADGQTMIRVRDTLVPVCWLHRYYDEPAVDETLEGRIVVVVQTAQGGLAVPVDTLLGNQQIMLKPMRGVLSGVRGAAGCGMLRSGDVALAIDCERLHA